MSSAADEFVVDFPTLGFLAADWIAAHCLVPDGFRKGDPFEMYDWQLWCAVNHYRVKPGATVGPWARSVATRSRPNGMRSTPSSRSAARSSPPTAA